MAEGTLAEKARTPRRNKLIGGAAVLAAGSIIAKVIGALYRIPLTNILGAEGMGMYQLVFPVFALFMTLSVGGIPTALSRIVAEKRTAGQPVRRYLVAALASLTGVSLAAGILVAAASGIIAGWQGNPDTYIGYIAIAPAIPLVGVIAALRGWFQGEMYMLPTALSNVIEQAVKLAAGIALAAVLARRSAAASVCGALIGVTLSELAAAVYLVITYLVRGRGRAKERMLLTRDEAKGMFRIAFPIAAVTMMLPLSNFLDSLVIVNMLSLRGADTAAATAGYGLYSGPVSSLINMPIVVIMSLAVAIVPSVSVSRTERNIDAILVKSRLSVKLTYLIGVPAAVLFMVFARDILALIYPALSASELDLAAHLLLICGVNVITLSAMQIYISLLQALDRTKYAVLSLACAVIVKVVLSLALVRYIGITGAAIASVLMGATALAAANLSFLRLTSLRLEKNIGTILAAGVIMAVTAAGLRYAISSFAVRIAVGVTISALIYLTAAAMLGALTEEDAAHLPLGKYFVKFRKLVRFWEYDKKR